MEIDSTIRALLSIIFILHVTSSDPDIIISMSAILCAIFCLFILRKTGKYKTVAYSLVGFGSLLVQFGLFIVADTLLMVSVAWIMLMIIMGYYLLDRIWGTIALIANMVLLFFYVALFENGSAQYLDLTPSYSTNLKALVNLAVLSLIIAYLIYNFIKTIEIANIELYQSNIQLSKQNLEKEVLLKEIHHRVKNNLQLISSMLSLQANEISDELVLIPFTEAQNRIRSMSLIHEKMYESNDLAQIEIETYFITLIEEIVKVCKKNTAVKIDVHSNVIQGKLKDLVPLALIINELVTNSLKYAFDETTDPTISVSLEKKDSILSLIYQDNGSGGAEPKIDGIGFKLITALTQQLNGKYEIIDNQGTSYKFTFQVDSDDISWIADN